MEEADGEEALLEGLGLGRLGVEVGVGVVEVAHAQRGLDAARRLDGHLDRVLVRIRVRVRVRVRVRGTSGVVPRPWELSKRLRSG